MRRSKMIEELVKIYDTRPENCSSYHIVDVLLYAAEKRGMRPPAKSFMIEYDTTDRSRKIIESIIGSFIWEEEEDLISFDD